jgi:hypothetical protein
MFHLLLRAAARFDGDFELGESCLEPRLQRFEFRISLWT